MKRLAATVAALALGVTVAALRTMLAPIRWVGDLTANPVVDDDPLAWEPHEDDLDCWPELRVAPDPLVSHNGSSTEEKAR